MHTQNKSVWASSLKPGYYLLGPRSMTFMVYRRPDKNGDHENTIVAVVSSSKWYRQTGNRWCSFAFHNDEWGLVVWKKFRGTNKRGRNWDEVASVFRKAVNNGIQPAFTLEEGLQLN